MIHKGETRFGKSNDPADGKKQDYAKSQGYEKSDFAGFVLLVFRKLGGNNRYKNDVVYTKYDFKKSEGQ
jgi:hypothetical protein